VKFTVVYAGAAVAATNKMNAIDAGCDNRRGMAGHIMAQPVAEVTRA